MSQLIRLFKDLPLPSAVHGYGFSAVPARPDSPHRLGKDVNGCPCLLIALDRERKTQMLPNSQLKNIRVVYDLECKITHDGRAEEGVFSIVTFTGDEPSLNDSFLRFCEIILDSIGDSPDRRTVSRILDRCVRLFKNITNAPRKTIQGLWAELLFINLAKNPASFIQAWHVNPEDRCDFNFGKKRYEIKSSSGRAREHFFSQEQLSPPKGTEIIIVSMFVEVSDTGMCIGELVDDLKKKLGTNIELVEKIVTVCYETLGNTLDESYNLKFDIELAKGSIMAFDSASIPKIDSATIPKEVSNVKYQVNLSRLEGNSALLNFKHS